MTRIRVLAKAGIVAGLAALGIGAMASSASAHTPEYGKNCSGYHVSLTNYGQGSTRKLVVDGGTIADGGFSGTYTKTDTWDQTKSHTISLVVHSSDGPSGDVNWLATQQPCQEGSTTTGVNTTTTVATTTTAATTTTVPSTTTTPTSTPTSTPVSQVTTSPPTSAAPTAPTEPNVPSSVQEGPPRTAKPPLPATGTEANLLIGLGVTAVISGIVLLFTTRRRSPA